MKILTLILLMISVSAHSAKYPEKATLEVQVTDTEGKLTGPYLIHFSVFRSLIFSPGNWETHSSCKLQIQNPSAAHCKIENWNSNVLNSATHSYLKVSLIKSQRTYTSNDYLCPFYNGNSDFEVHPRHFEVKEGSLWRPAVLKLKLKDCVAL